MKLDPLELPLNVLDSGFKAGISAALTSVGALVGVMGVAVKATFDWAQELDSIQDIIGGTNTEAAALNFTLRKSGTSTETFNRSLAIMSKGLVKADGTLDTVGKGMAAWGINVKDANGQVKTSSQLIADASKKYNELGTQQERVNFLTEVFGRGGAEMIDFFDTLSAEGGLDAVTQKVEAFGLAIDPARYEQFNRNLEELKMIGLGLAVSFTENIMPAVERFMGWLATAAQSEEWQGFKSFVSSFSTAIGEGDWETAKMLLLTKLDEVDNWVAEKFNGMDWTGAGASFGAWIDKAFAEGSTLENLQLPDSITALLDGIDSFFQSAVGADDFGGWDAYFQAWWDDIAGWFDKIESFMRDRLGALQGLSISKNENWINDMKNGAANSNFTSITVEKNPNWFNELLGNSSNRASGGPVIAGQSYNVAEFFQPERFTPSTNGRIDPIGTGGDMLTTLTLMLQQFADEIARSNRVAFEKVGRR